MSILSMIREKKAEFSERQNERSARTLQNLKTQRIKAEGKDNLSRLKHKERSRIKKARSDRFDRQTAGFKKAASALKKLKKKSESKSSFGVGFGGGGINPAFGLGREKPKEKKKENIIIKIQR